MKYPRINRKPCREVNIPQLSGGLNLRDSLTDVRDNQMIDCVNMWYKDGMLRTRPNFEIKEDTSGLPLGNSSYRIKDKRIHYDIVNDEAVLISLKVMNVEETLGSFICFFWQTGNKQTRAGDISFENECDYFVVEKNGIIYCYLSDCKIYKLDYKKGEKNWSEVSEEEYYIPTVLAHGKPTDGGYTCSGTMFEGYNLLTPKYKMVFSTYNINDESHNMRYKLMLPIPLDVSGYVTAKITHSNGTIKTHTVEWEGNGKDTTYFENVDQEDGLWMFVNHGYVMFAASKGSASIKTLTEEDYIEDNLEITSFYAPDESEIKKVFCMTRSIWFGGAAKGINGGSRLFLCGNTAENEGALVIWSGLDKPLYFPENNYVYVGNNAHPVTAFGKQGENLIIFKPNEIYYSYYVSNDNIDAEDLINQTVVDYEASSVFFPIITLHSSIGCDCPDTIQLCRNRLVWLNSNGKVYTLVSANQYSEMTVYAVSDLIENKIKICDADELKTAVSQDFGGYYMLIINSEAYLMDYNSYGYTHIYSYTKTEDANVLIPWYYWTLLPEESFVTEGRPCYCAVGDSIIAIYECRPSTAYVTSFCTLNVKNKGYEDKYAIRDAEKNVVIKTSTIKSGLSTKLFDFSAAGYLKNVDRVGVSFGNNGGEAVNITFITDKGNESDMVVPVGSSTDEREASFVRYKNFYPSARAVRTFGIKLECDGPLVVDGLSLQYRLLGGVK